MKKVWIVEYEALTDEGTVEFEDFNSAKIYARSLISKYSEAPEYLEDLRNGHRKKYRAAIADFFEKYFSDPLFPYTDADIPSDDANDYKEEAPEGMVFGEELDEDDEDAYYEYESPEEYFEEDEFEVYIGNGEDWINTDNFEQCELPNIETNLILAADEKNTYKYDEDTLSIKIYRKLYTGGRTNPILILEKLKNRQIVDPDCYNDDYKYEEAYGVGEKAPMSKRTVYRHINLLCDLGYVITKKESGFALAGKTAPKNIKFGKSSYPIMVLDVLESAGRPLLQNDIIEEIQSRYNGTTIHRKAIGNIIKDLIDLEYDIRRTKEGYFLA